VLTAVSYTHLDVYKRQGYQRIKLKCKPGWDVEVFDRVRNRWPEIMLSCDANSAYKFRDSDHVASFDAFDLLMICLLYTSRCV